MKDVMRQEIFAKSHDAAIGVRACRVQMQVQMRRRRPQREAWAMALGVRRRGERGMTERAIERGSRCPRRRQWFI